MATKVLPLLIDPILWDQLAYETIAPFTIKFTDPLTVPDAIEITTMIGLPVVFV